MQRGRAGTARIGVITILDEEFGAAREALGATISLLGTGCWTPDRGTLDVVLTQSPDRGNMAAGGTMRNMLEHFRPEVVFLTGIAGGVRGREGIAAGDV